MPNSAIQHFNQVTVVDNVEDVVITPIVDDGTNSGTFVRAIRIYGQPNGTNGPAVFELRIKATVASKIDITTPNIAF